MFEEMTTDDLLRGIEDCRREEAMLIARRLTAVAGLLWHRTADAQDAPDADPGYALITGFTRTSAEIGAAMNISPKAAGDMVGHADALDSRLPHIGRLLAQGETDWSTVKLIITRTALVEAELMPQLDQSLADRMSAWQCWSRQRVINAVDAAVCVADPEAAKERRTTADNDRHVSLAAQPNGMARLHGAIPAPAAAVVDKRLHDMATSVCHRDSRTIAQRRADALLALSEGHALACDCGHPDCPAKTTQDTAGPRFAINVIAGEKTLCGCSDEPGYLEGYGVIDAHQVRQLAQTATVRPLFEPTVSDAAALTYQPSAALERWIRCRDLTCCFPGCDRPAWTADIDHTIPYRRTNPQSGGRTVPQNTKCYCRQHHRTKTFLTGPGGWHDEQLPDGTVILTSPTGRIYRNTPAGADLFPQLRPACAEPVPRPRNRQREKQAHTKRARRKLRALRPVNTEQRRINQARRRHLEAVTLRNRMRKTLFTLKGTPSTSPFCKWVNDPLEDEHITADWRPPPQTPPTPDDDHPPF
jgi:Domain of unknown function (DUF222)